ncbi:MAG TPA: hybrid sensor histidine kinase/response regulator [Gemmataceae bacterium]|jgi:signal transduction histidine kinase|nr:hybrid sensor histidine kinase/response regulator [Gemmataceae bacterium]
MDKRRHTLLVVDDEPDVVRSVHDLLRLEYHVVGATSGTIGLEQLEKQQVHIVMADQRMPDMTGVEFLAQVRRDYPNSVRLLFTGYADIKAVIDAINQGHVYRYIAKPWDPDELQAIIRQAATHYDLVKERGHLLKEVQAKNAALEKANADLQSALTLKEAFIRVASHELRTPVTILLGLSQLAVGIPGVPAPLDDWLARMHQSALRLSRHVDQLGKMLAVGRFERSLERQPTDLGVLLHEVVRDVQAFIVQRHQKLILDIPANLGSLPLEGSMIRDSLAHLLLNAIKFTPDGGKLQLAAERLPDRSVAIRVADEGVGIAGAEQVHLFKTFFTGGDIARHSSGIFEFGRKGLGLGLSLVRAFVEMHGGKIEVTSEAGKGSCFTILLPAESGVNGPSTLT